MGHLFLSQDVPLVEFMYFVFTPMLSQSYRRLHESLMLCLCVMSFER